MTDKLFFNRDTRVFVRLSDYFWEIPVLDGFSFSQATNATEITLNEMDNATTGSRRARQMFNDSYAPAEWSFSSYARPRFASSKNRSAEEVLWALLAGPASWDNTNKDFESGTTPYITQTSGSNQGYQKIDFTKSNTSTLGTADIFFVLGANNIHADGADKDVVAYRIEDCCVNEASFDFDVEGLATINWSGFGKLITEVPAFVGASASMTDSHTAPGIGVVAVAGATESAPQVLISKTDNFGTNYEAVTSIAELADADSYIRNKLSFLTVTDKGNANTVYEVVMTGGNLTVNNNITYVTPETLGVVNQPLGHVTGTRTVSGNVTCYLSVDGGSDNASTDLFEQLVEDTTTVTQNYELIMNIGHEPDQVTQDPCIQFRLPKCHLELPTHSFEDVISLETNFHALPTDIDSADELEVRYAG